MDHNGSGHHLGEGDARELDGERFGGQLENSPSADRAAPQASSSSSVENFAFDYSVLTESVRESVKRSAIRIREHGKRMVREIADIARHQRL
jgi:hypothetical protein